MCVRTLYTANPEEIMCAVTAPTGSAAFNIKGSTLHSAFNLPLIRNKSKPYQRLSDEKLNSLKLKVANLKILIIDEISMVGHLTLMHINERLKEIKVIYNFPLIDIHEFILLKEIFTLNTFKYTL